MSEPVSFRSSFNGFNRNEVVDYIEKIINEKTELVERIGNLETKVEELKSENDNLQEAVKAENKKKDEPSKCEQCDYAKVYESKMGAAMLDARRFSDMLVNEANEKSADIFSTALNNANETSVELKKLSVQLIQLAESFSSSFNILQNKLNSMQQSVDVFMKDVQENEGVFLKNPSKKIFVDSVSQVDVLSNDNETENELLPKIN